MSLSRPGQFGDPNSQKVLEQTIINRIGGNSDNIYVSYGLSLVAISLLGSVTTAVPSLFRFGYHKISKFFAPNYPTITFIITRYKSLGHLNNAGNAIIAWMEHLKNVINSDLGKDSANRKQLILKIRNVATSKGRDYRTGLLRDSENHWLPNQTESFIVDKNIFCKFKTRTLEHKEKGEAQSIEEYTLQIYTDLRGSEGLKYLLRYNDKIVEKYEMRLKSRFENQSHIFEYDSYDEKGDSIKWIANEFSSSRQLDHIWFDEKSTFVEAYNNFLFNKEEYDIRGDPYTFSILLYGPPGCGKTSLLKSLINFDKNKRDGFISHLFVVPFSKIKNSDVFNRIMFDKKINGTEIEMNKRIYVFEDFDANIQSNVFNIRKGLAGNKGGFDKLASKKDKDKTDKDDESKDESKDDSKKKKEEDKKDELAELLERKDDKTKKKDAKRNETLDKLKQLFVDDEEEEKSKIKIHLSDILNTLDGLCERTGQRCIWTTNKAPPQKYFDPAFLRPGRMDMIIKLGECDYNGIKYLLKQYFCLSGQNKNQNKNKNKNIQINDSDLIGIDEGRFTPAQLKQICKESGSLKSAIEMLREICIESKESDDVVGDLGLGKDSENEMKAQTPISELTLPQTNNLALLRTFSAPAMIPDGKEHSIKLHSGHWMSPRKPNIAEPPLLHDVPSKSATTTTTVTTAKTGTSVTTSKVNVASKIEKE